MKHRQSEAVIGEGEEDRGSQAFRSGNRGVDWQCQKTWSIGSLGDFKLAMGKRSILGELSLQGGVI